MKLVKELPEIFEEFGEQQRKAFLEVKQYKDRGIPVAGMYCAYFPTELAIAVGAIPVGLCSFSNDTVAAAEQELPKSMCPLVKSSYGFAKEDKCPFFHFSDLVIGETTCDGKKKMYELMSEFKPVYVMELPNSQSEKGLHFWRTEVIRAKEYMEEFFDIVVTEEMLRDAVHLNNQIRSALKELCEVMKLNPAPVFGEDIQKMVLGSKYRFDFHESPKAIRQVTEKILEEYRSGNHLECRPRILVTGCPVGGDSLKIIHEIEKNGGVVVAIENCSGVRTLSSMVEEDTDDIYEAIAKKYLSTGCSIMTPNDNRIELLGEIIDEYQVDGVVEMILTGCHSTGAESHYIRRFVSEEKHIPYIAIDTDYSAADTGQISTRMAAFLEMLQPKGGRKLPFEINKCYKIVLSGMTEGISFQDVLNELQQYTGFEFILENAETKEHRNKESYYLEKMLMDGRENLIAYIPKEISKKTAGKVLDILEKGYLMQKNFLHKDSRELPDYLWVIGDSQLTVKTLYEQLKREPKFAHKIHSPQEKSLYLTEITGKEERETLIQTCREHMADKDGKILVGNGFDREEAKEQNRTLQQYVFQIAQDKSPAGKVYLTEQYYFELAVSYISEKTEAEYSCIEELKVIQKEDKEKGRELYDTLYWYLRMKRNVAQTAAKLKLHRNTLLPRIARLNELLGLDEMDGMECERIILAMEIEKTKEKSGRG